MGGTIFSERLNGEMLRLTSGSILQSVNFDITITPPEGIYRILGVYVQGDVGARTSAVQVSLRTVGSGREMPIFVWDDANANDVESNIRIVENGAAVSNDFALIQGTPQAMPTLGIGAGQASRVGDEIIMRGSSLAFGAGNVEVVALVYVAQSTTTSVSSIGLPIPGW